MADNQIWKRLPSDTDKSFKAFCIYRDMGASRSVRDVAQELNKSLTVIARWSTANDWTKRVAAFDASLDEKNLDENAERQKLIKDSAFEDYLFLRKLITKYKDDYEKAELKGVSPHDASTLAALMKQADDSARRAVGLPDKISESKQENTIKGKLSLSWEQLMQGTDDGSSTPDDSDPFT
jgi:hypothetical protein